MRVNYDECALQRVTTWREQLQNHNRPPTNADFCGSSGEVRFNYISPRKKLMKIKILINETKTSVQVVERIDEISQECALAHEVSVAVEDVRKQGLERFGRSLHVDKV